MPNELDEAFQKKFLGPAKFAQEIEKLVQENKELNYIDAIVVFCEQNSI